MSEQLFQQRCEEIRFKVGSLIKVVKDKYGIDLNGIIIRYDITGRAAGQAKSEHGRFVIRFNKIMMMNESWNHIINSTVPHEVAHVVCFANPHLGRGHNNGWKSVCISLGGNAKRCHSEDTSFAARARKRYQYTNESGFSVVVSSIVHGRIQRGTHSYVTRNGMMKLDNTWKVSLI